MGIGVPSLREQVLRPMFISPHRSNLRDPFPFVVFLLRVSPRRISWDVQNPSPAPRPWSQSDSPSHQDPPHRQTPVRVLS